MVAIITIPSTKEDLFPEDGEMRLMCRETQHNQISIQAMKDVTGVGIMPRLPMTRENKKIESGSPGTSPSLPR